MKSADLGARFDLGAPLQVSVGGFYTRLSDDIAFERELIRRLVKSTDPEPIPKLVVKWLARSAHTEMPNEVSVTGQVGERGRCI